jgi:hypothetical protein
MIHPRSRLVWLPDMPYCQVVNHCVRQAFVCGNNHAAQQNFDHRRQNRIETRIRELASVFTLDVAAYAVRSKHHQNALLRVNKAQVRALDAEAFTDYAGPFFKAFASAVGIPAKLIEIAAHRQQRALRGLAAARRMFGARKAA